MCWWLWSVAVWGEGSTDDSVFTNATESTCAFYHFNISSKDYALTRFFHKEILYNIL
jgi:hypothetical protein